VANEIKSSGVNQSYLDKRKASPMSSKAIVPQSDPLQLPLIPEEEKPRGCIINGIAHISIHDAYRIYGKSSNPQRDWQNDLKKLRQQGNSTVFVLFSFETNGQKTKGTPVANEEQMARIAQVAEFPEWEPVRQRMAELLVEDHRGTNRKSIPPRQTKEYRRLIDSGYTDKEALEWLKVDEHGKTTHAKIASEWYHRDGDIPKLTNRVNENVTGESATDMKERWQIKESPRRYMSLLKKASIDVVEGLAAALHIGRDSQGTSKLLHDVDDASGVVDWDAFDALLSDTDVKRPLPKPKQPNLLKNGEDNNQ